VASADDLDEAVARELARDVDDSLEVALAKKADAILQSATDVQRDLILDPSKRKAARVPRRGGKTGGAQRKVANYLLRHPEAVGWYIAPKLKQARKLVWSPLRKLSRDYSLGLRFHKTEASVTFPNEAQLWLAGGDNDDSISDLLGHQPHLVVIDECGSFPPDRLEFLIDEAEPSLMDNDGTLLLISTPGVTLAGPYFEITGGSGTQIIDFPDGRRALSRPYRERRQKQWKGVAWEWSLHTWTLKENTARPDLWKKALELKKKKGWSDENPRWQRLYLGLWTKPDPKLRTFGFDDDEHTWEPLAPGERNPFGLPEEHAWRFLIGLDQGSSDPMAIQVGAYSLTSPLLLHCYEWEADADAKITVGELAHQLKLVIALCGGEEYVEEVVSDHGQLGDTILATLAEDHGIFVEKADKKNKLDHIELTNGELKEGRTKILKRSRLAREMGQLQNDPKRPGKTKTGVPNNNTDAFLYLSTRARDRNTSKNEDEPTLAEKKEARLKAEADRFIQQRRKQREPDAPRAEIDWETTEWQDR
jgi:hypothetical protein